MLSAVLVLGTTSTASFFLAVVLSGMGAGVINTFLFIRYFLLFVQRFYDAHDDRFSSCTNMRSRIPCAKNVLVCGLVAPCARGHGLSEAKVC